MSIDMHEIHLPDDDDDPRPVRTTPYDLDEIKALGEHVLDVETETLQKDGESPHPKFFLFLKAGGINMLFVDGRIMSTSSGKTELAHKVREMIKQHDAIATAFFSDTYMAESVSEEADRMRHSLGLDLIEGARLGLVKNIREMLLLQIESPLGCIMLRQFYRREGKREKIVLEERTETRPELALGKFSGFFPQEEAGNA